MEQFQWNDNLMEMYGYLKFEKRWHDSEKIDAFKAFCQAEKGHLLRDGTDGYICWIRKTVGDVAKTTVPIDQLKWWIVIVSLLMAVLCLLGIILVMQVKASRDSNKSCTTCYRMDAENQLNRDG